MATTEAIKTSSKRVQQIPQANAAEYFGLWAILEDPFESILGRMMGQEAEARINTDDS